MGKDRFLSRELADLAFAIMDIFKHELKSRTDVGAPTLTQFKMLHAINDGIRHVGKLSELFGISQPATSKMVDMMVKEGLLKRVPHAKDRRLIELHLTAEASASLARLYKRAFERIDERLAELSGARTKILAQNVREIAKLLTGAQR